MNRTASLLSDNWISIAREKPRITPGTLELLKALDDHFDFPCRQPWDTDDEWLASGLVIAFSRSKLTRAQINKLREVLELTEIIRES